MEHLDTLMLSRLQFATNITFHILFPTISIALGWVLLFMRWRWLRTGDTAWLGAWRWWTKVFALTFAMGVVSGVTMSFQFGTNWPGFMEKAGNIAGPLLGYEVLTAFFLEATFLGVMLFGHGRVSERVHLAANFLVAFGTTMSAFWILSLNSWMHTPQGFEVINGELHATDWWAIVFNPSLPYRLTHTLLASGLTVSFLMAGLAAWQTLRGHAHAGTPKVLRLSVTLAAVLIPLQILAGDMHGLNTLKHQPAKVAAMEGVWETERGAPLLLFAWPNEAERRNDWAIGVPQLASLILTHDAQGEIRGLNEFQGAHPPVKPLFFGFRIMVGVGVLMLITSWAAFWWLQKRRWQWQGAPTLPTWLWQVLHGMTFSGWIATVAGWYVTEIGRQPYIVQGVLRTADAVTRTPASTVGWSLAGYLVVYTGLLIAYIGVLRYLASKPLDTSLAPARLPGQPPATTATTQGA